MTLRGSWSSVWALVRRKLTSFRDIDRVHVADMMSVSLIDGAVRASLTLELLARLDEVALGAASRRFRADMVVYLPGARHTSSRSDPNSSFSSAIRYSGYDWRASLAS